MSVKKILVAEGDQRQHPETNAELMFGRLYPQDLPGIENLAEIADHIATFDLSPAFLDLCNKHNELFELLNLPSDADETACMEGIFSFIGKIFAKLKENMRNAAKNADIRSRKENSQQWQEYVNKLWAELEQVYESADFESVNLTKMQLNNIADIPDFMKRLAQHQNLLQQLNKINVLTGKDSRDAILRNFSKIFKGVFTKDVLVLDGDVAFYMAYKPQLIKLAKSEWFNIEKVAELIGMLRSAEQQRISLSCILPSIAAEIDKLDSISDKEIAVDDVRQKSALITWYNIIELMIGYSVRVMSETVDVIIAVGTEINRTI